MKEFIEKLIGRLEEEKESAKRRNAFDSELSYKRAIEIVNQLAEEYNNSNDSMEIQIAKNYAKWITKCGVNVTEKWITATEQAYALNEAYMRGMQDERDKFARWQYEHKDGWIPCSERLPEVETKVLIHAKRKYRDGSFRDIITTAMYEDGTMLEDDSKWRWEDIEGEWDEENDCYIIPKGWWEDKMYNADGELNHAVDDEVIAWQPLPDPYIPKEEEQKGIAI